MQLVHLSGPLRSLRETTFLMQRTQRTAENEFASQQVTV